MWSVTRFRPPCFVRFSPSLTEGRTHRPGITLMGSPFRDARGEGPRGKGQGRPELSDVISRPKTGQARLTRGSMEPPLNIMKEARRSLGRQSLAVGFFRF